jgi:cardiolipin synthase
LWLVVAVVSRDVLIVLAILLSWLMDHPVVIKPFIISKLNTAAQLVLASFVLADLAFALNYTETRHILVLVTGFLTFMSMAAYLRAWLSHMTGASDQVS